MLAVHNVVVGTKLLIAGGLTADGFSYGIFELAGPS